MQINGKWLALAVAGVVGVGVGAFQLGGGSATAANGAAASPVVGNAAGKASQIAQNDAPAPQGTPGAQGAQGAGAWLPSGHPPAGKAPEPVREGKLPFDATQKFVHFRVGNKNVKRIFIDGNTVWVGTSGGAIRYDTGSDDYKLFDVKSGLLSNGIFYVGKLGERVALGTYGGGLSLMDTSQKLETFNIPDGLGDAFVYDVLQAKNGDVWIATWSGVNRVRGGAPELSTVLQ